MRGVEPAAAPGHGEAGDEPLQIPLERARQRLVEVVHVEDEPPVGRRVGAEVRQVRVAAQLGVQARPRRAGEVGGHEVRGAAVEGERRDEHPPVADRHELGHARLRLLLEQGDRVGAIRGRLPRRVSLPRHLRARGLAACATRSATVGVLHRFGAGLAAPAWGLDSVSDFVALIPLSPLSCL